MEADPADVLEALAVAAAVVVGSLEVAVVDKERATAAEDKEAVSRGRRKYFPINQERATEVARETAVDKEVDSSDRHKCFPINQEEACLEACLEEPATDRKACPS